MNHTWRHEKRWKIEEAYQDWHVERLYRQSRCLTCEEVHVTGVENTRRRYQVRQLTKPEHAYIEKLPVRRWLSLDVLIGVLHQNRFELLETLSEWLEVGWIEVEETMIDQKWQIERIRVSPRWAAERVERRHAARGAREQQAVTNMTLLLRGWDQDYQVAVDLHQGESDLLEVLHHLHRLLDEQEKALAAGRCVPVAGTSLMRGGPAHQRWVASLRGIVELLAHPRLEYERVFSATWLGDSKAFLRERTALTQFLSIPGGLEQIGLVKHTPIVLSWGEWQATLSTCTIDGRAGVSFVATPADTISRLQDMRVDADQLIIIENQTAFEMLVRPPYRRARTLYLFGAGFSGNAERTLVSLWLHAKSDLLWFIWTDCDIGGVYIQEHWHNWAMQAQLPPPEPYRWTKSDLQAWRSLGTPLTENDRVRLERTGHPLALMLCECGYTVEQEAILSLEE